MSSLFDDANGAAAPPLPIAETARVSHDGTQP